MNEPVEGSFADKLAKALGRNPIVEQKDPYVSFKEGYSAQSGKHFAKPRKTCKPKTLSVGYGKDNK